MLALSLVPLLAVLVSAALLWPRRRRHKKLRAISLSLTQEVIACR